jgi:hypothetical protein
MRRMKCPRVCFFFEMLLFIQYDVQYKYTYEVLDIFACEDKFETLLHLTTLPRPSNTCPVFEKMMRDSRIKLAISRRGGFSIPL